MITAALAVLKTDEQRNIISDFYQMYKNRFYAIAYEHLHNPQDSEEAIQEAFLRITVNPDKFFSLSGDERIYHKWSAGTSAQCFDPYLFVGAFHIRNRRSAQSI